MREIRFRGKRTDGKGWAFGDLAHEAFDGTSKILPIAIRQKVKGYYSYPIEVIQETVGQFTGLQDAYGVDIYEGDLLKLRDPYNFCWTVNCGQVVFSNEYVGGWVLISDKKGALNIGSRTNHVKVMGNIHENPELLKS